MLSELAVSGYTLPIPDLSSEVGPRHSGSTGTVELAALAKQAAKARAALKEQNNRFNAFYRQAKRLANNPDELESLAGVLLVKEQELARKFLPKIRSLQRELTEDLPAETPSPGSWRAVAEEMLDVFVSWLEQYQNLRIRLIKLASDRQKETEPGSGVLSTDSEIDAYLRRLVAK